MSLRARLLFLVLLATLLPALLLAWRFVRDSDEEIKGAVRALSAAADNAAADLDHRVQGTAQLHYGLAHSRVLDSTDRAACSAYLSEVREAYPQYTGILTVLPDGSLFCDSLRTGRNLNLADRSYFKRVMQGNDGLTLEPVFGRLTGNSVLQIVYPARSEAGVLRFILVASLSLQKFTETAPLGALQSPLQLLLVDRRGTVMSWTSSRRPPQAAGTSIADTDLFRLAQAKAGGGGVGEVVGPDGKVQVWAVAANMPARDTGLQVMLGVDREDLVAQVKRDLKQDLWLLAAATSLLFGGVWLVAEWSIRRQLARITGMVAQLSSGDLAVRIEPPHPHGELGALMGLLNSTAESLQHQRDSIDELGLRLRQAQKMEAIGTLAGGIAHDFNNIVGAILGNLAIAQQEIGAGQSTQHSLSQIRLAAQRARDLVQRIQAFSRQDKPALVRQALRPIVEEGLALVRVALPAGVGLRTELATTPLWVAADATQLHQVLMNLCSNAWQALQEPHGVVTVGLDAVEFGDAAAQRPPGLGAGSHAHLWVRDTGCGVSGVDRERIFEPFFTTRGTQGGTGLGLSVVHGIVATHHGSIVVDSAAGQGSTFHIYLPQVADRVVDRVADAVDAAAADGLSDRAAEVQPLPCELGDPTAPAGHGQRVLYLDDDETMCLMVDRLLTRAGYRVTCHSSAHQALANVLADPTAFDLVVTDFNMPELSGLEVSQTLADLRPDLPVIIASGYVTDELPAQARQAGVRELVRKENVLDDLLPAVARALAAPEA